MDWLWVLFSRLAALFGREKLDADLDEELRAHIDLAMEENVKRGMPEQEARTAALRAFGGVTQTKERYRTGRGIPAVETVMRDARYALRQLSRNPGFTLTVIFTLALSVGANTAIFSIVNRFVLAPGDWARAQVARMKASSRIDAPASAPPKARLKKSRRECA